MPEGPEIKTIAYTLNLALKGESLSEPWCSNLSLRAPINYTELKKLSGKKIDKVNCFGKIIFIYSENNPILMAQMGMTGQLKIENKEEKVAMHTHIRWPLKNSSKELRYVDIRRFGLFDI